MAEIYNDMLIRNVDCGVLYFQIKDDKVIKEYEQLKKEKAAIEEMTERDEKRLLEVQTKIEQLSKQIHSFDKNIEFSTTNNRFRFSGTIADSLMGRKLRQVAKTRQDDDRIKTVGDADYTDLIINIKFKSDIMIPDDTPKRGYDKETDSIVELEGKKMKRLISKKKLRQMAYKDGITINGIHYVNFQRTSSKARTGNCLFIDERYFDEMDGWQNLGIPFRKMVRSEDRSNPNPFETADIVGARSYQSLISSSIIGELEIDPYSILLIDDVSGHATMDCNVVKLVESEDGKGKELKAVREPYTQFTDLWDGQSLLDSSVFENGTYATKGKDGTIKEHSYKDYGFILLRNHFFKTAVFNTNLQAYYRERYKGVENPIIEDSFGNPFEPSKILMVTTRNSAKIFKFADIICTYCIDDDKKTRLKELEEPLQKLYQEMKANEQAVTNAKRKYTMLCNFKPDEEGKKVPPTPQEIEDARKALIEAEDYRVENLDRLEREIKSLSKPVKFEQERLTWDWYREQIKNQKFGCCKTEHKSKFGDKQQLWYQVVGSLNFNKEELEELAKPQIDEINLMKTHVAWFKRQMDLRPSDNLSDTMMLTLLNINDDISRTKWYVDYRRSQIASIIKRLVAGKLQIKDSDFCTLVANPYEMLKASCGDKIESSIINDFECYCTRYSDGEELYGMRSPHICTGNNALLKNTYREEWKWFNFTDNILIINFWDKGAFLSPVWNGNDTDSDSSFIGNNPIILNKVKEAVADGTYLVPINDIPQKTKVYEFTDGEMAKVDGQLCNDFIGKICNLARDIQSLYFHLLNTGTEENKRKYLPMIYDDICILEVLSNVAIDSAKRRYEVNIASEIEKIKNRPYMTAQGVIIQNDAVVFKETRYKKSLSEETIAEYEKLVGRRNLATTEEEIANINAEIDKILTKTDTYMIRPDFTKKLKASPKKKKVKKKHEDEEQKEIYRQKQIAYAQEQKILKEKTYRKMQSPMDILSEIVDEKIKRSPRTEFIPCFVDVLKSIPKGIKADYNRIEAIKKVALETKKDMNYLQNEYDAKRKSFDEFYEELNTIKRDAINKIANYKVTTWDIHKLIRDVYDIRPTKDKHGKYVKDENGKKMFTDRRDKKIIDAEVGLLMLQWVYAAHKDLFLEAIKSSGEGTISYVREYVPEKVTSSKITSFKDLQRIVPKEIFELDGKQYVIETKRLDRKKAVNE